MKNFAKLVEILKEQVHLAQTGFTTQTTPSANENEPEPSLPDYWLSGQFFNSTLKLLVSSEDSRLAKVQIRYHKSSGALFGIRLLNQDGKQLLAGGAHNWAHHPQAYHIKELTLQPSEQLANITRSDGAMRFCVAEAL